MAWYSRARSSLSNSARRSRVISCLDSATGFLLRDGNTTRCPVDCSQRRDKGKGEGLTSFLPQPHPLQAPAHFVDEVRQLVDVVDERNADAGQPGLAQIGELGRDVIGVADDRQAAHALSVLVTLQDVL